jgi:hypothetical protein
MPSTYPRLLGWILLAVFLQVLLFFVAPQQAPVALYKFSLITLAVVVAYHLDRALFPYSRPDIYLCKDWRSEINKPANETEHFMVLDGYALVFAAAMLRRAIIVAAVVIGVALGL